MKSLSLKLIISCLLLTSLAGCIIVPVGGHHGGHYEAPHHGY